MDTIEIARLIGGIAIGVTISGAGQAFRKGGVVSGRWRATMVAGATITAFAFLIAGETTAAFIAGGAALVWGLYAAFGQLRQDAGHKAIIHAIGRINEHPDGRDR